jgi:hypothetical protein
MARTGKLKIPKRIAGVKIPKSVRKGALGSFLNSSAGQLLLAEALVLLGGVLGVKGTDSRSAVGRTLRHPVEALTDIGEGGSALTAAAGASVADESERIAAAFREGIEAFRVALSRSSEPGSHAEASVLPTEGDRDRASERGKKNSPSQGTEKSSTAH